MGRAEALLALKWDLVLTGGQLKRHCGAHRGLMHGVPHIERLVVPIHMRAAVMPVVRFYSLNEELLRCTRAPFLGHIAGTAEMRWMLGCPRSWRLGSRGATVHDPDAHYRDEQRRLVAVEYDRGTYTRRKVTRKIESYREQGADRIVWGVVSPLRGDRLRLLYGIEVMLVDWWS